MNVDDIVYGRESSRPCKAIGGGDFEPGLDRQIDIYGYSLISAGSRAYGLRWIESGLKPGLIFFDRKVPPDPDVTWRTTLGDPGIRLKTGMRIIITSFSYSSVLALVKN